MRVSGIPVSENLTWHLDLPVIEWLIVLIMLVVLDIVGDFITRRAVKAAKNDGPSVRQTGW